MVVINECETAVYAGRLAHACPRLCLGLHTLMVDHDDLRNVNDGIENSNVEDSFLSSAACIAEDRHFSVNTEELLRDDPMVNARD